MGKCDDQRRETPAQQGHKSKGGLVPQSAEREIERNARDRKLFSREHGRWVSARGDAYPNCGGNSTNIDGSVGREWRSDVACDRVRVRGRAVARVPIGFRFTTRVMIAISGLHTNTLLVLGGQMVTTATRLGHDTRSGRRRFRGCGDRGARCTRANAEGHRPYQHQHSEKHSNEHRVPLNRVWTKELSQVGPGCQSNEVTQRALRVPRSDAVAIEPHS